MLESPPDSEGTTESASVVYRRRLAELQSLQSKGGGRDDLFVGLKILLGVVALISLVWVLKHPARWEILLAAATALVITFVLHERVLRSLRHRSRLVRFYERGLSRIDGSWSGQGEGGERFLDLAHPYARDLDLFGNGSLFELLCTTRTRVGEEKLAEWLSAPASVEEIRTRQLAIVELAPQLAFRESLSVFGETVGAGVRPQALAEWGEADAVFRSKSLTIGAKSLPTVTAALAAGWILSLIAWGVWGYGTPALLLGLINVGVTLRLRHRVSDSSAGLDRAVEDLALLSETLQYLEGQRYTSPKLMELQSKLLKGGVSASAAIRKLLRIVEYLQSNDNWFVKIVDLFVFWTAQCLFAAEEWQQRYGPAIREWLVCLGELEALAALSGYAYEHPEDVFPDFVEGEARFEALGFAHPLIAEDQAVRNDLKLGIEMQLMMISGPNMAGKSTFMRAVGVNVLLAQCGAPVRARSLRMSRIAVAASICILDSLQGGVSHFYAEIRRLKLISDMARGSIPVLFLMDELLSGTNSHDRLIGAQFIVRRLVEEGAIGIVTTHDLALTQIPNSLPFGGEGGLHASNYHFEDHIEHGELKFDYKLAPGVVRTSNALVLIRAIGLDIQTQDVHGTT